MSVESEHSAEEYAYLTTIGRVTGLPREIEIWFGARGNTIYMLAGSGHAAHWVMNLIVHPEVTVRIGDCVYIGRARVLEPGEEEQQARLLLAGKYQGWKPGAPLSGWARTALPVAVDLLVEAQEEEEG
jgi:deazaflavin-dependent oxidoreductase (nitroreductase family)